MAPEEAPVLWHPSIHHLSEKVVVKELAVGLRDPTYVMGSPLFFRRPDSAFYMADRLSVLLTRSCCHRLCFPQVAPVWCLCVCVSPVWQSGPPPPMACTLNMT